MTFDVAETWYFKREGRRIMNVPFIPTEPSDAATRSGHRPRSFGVIWYAGQGGNGVMASPASGEVCAALAMGQAISTTVADLGLILHMVTPALFPAAT
jgi:hypothetical protein